jgi:hypothetical protein
VKVFLKKMSLGFSIVKIAIFFVLIAFVIQRIGFGGSELAQAYIGGVPTFHPSLVRIQVSNSLVFSGVKVAPSTILTAAHCVRSAMEPGSRVTLVKGKGTRSEASINTVVTRRLVHPLLRGRDLRETYSDAPDLALFEVEDASLFEEMPINLGKIEAGDFIYVGGFGEKGGFFPDFGSYTWAKKAVQEFAETRMFVGLPDVATTAGEGVLSFPGSGDSGGPAMVRDSRNSLSIVGVNSSVSHQSDQFVVDQRTGRLIRSFARDPVLAVVKLGYASDQDPYGVVAWLKMYLPASSFRTERTGAHTK